jgi:hypothetical protein
MGAIDAKRCPHCVGRLIAIPLETPDGFDASGPLVLCRRCDGLPRDEGSLFLPPGWGWPIGEVWDV